MALYFITYDLRNKRDYQKLYTELEKFKALRVFESTWCFYRVNTSAEGLKNYFCQLKKQIYLMNMILLF